MTLGGNVCIRNGNLLDYCWREAVNSLLPICDVVSISDGESTDGTQEEIREWQKREPKIVLNVHPWTDPRGDVNWWPDWINYNRQHVQADMHIQLDADEVIHEEDYEKITEAARHGSTLFFHRLNFWRDHRHLIPEGHCCGTKVLRLAPITSPIPSDYPYAPAEDTLRRAVESSIRVFHYGFIRRRDAFFRKAREVQRIWVNSYDPRLEKAEGFAGNWMQMEGVTGWENNVTEYGGSHPAAARAWLRERGYDA